MGRLIDETLLQETLAKIPMEQRTFRKAVETAEEATTVLTLPDNPTNGDMIKSIFNPYCIHEDKYYVYVYLTETEWNSGVYFNRFRKNWWNSPYKRGTEVENTVSEETYTEEYNRRKEAEFKLYKLQDNIDKMIAEINKLRGCSCSNSDGIIDDVEDIINKYCKETNG